MSTYPATLDDLGATNPAGSDPMTDGAGHAAQHAEANDAIDAIQTTLGVDPQGGETDVAARLDAIEASIGGGGGSTWPPDDPPGSPSAYDYEFGATTTSLPAGWSWVNQGSATYDEKYGSGYILVPSSSGTNLRIIQQAAPSAPFTLTAKFRRVATTGTGAYFVGLVLRNSGSGKVANLAWDGRGLTWYFFNSPTSFNSYPGGFIDHRPADTIYLQAVVSSLSSVTLNWSADGAVFKTAYSGLDVAAFLSTCDSIGFTGNDESSTAPIYACDWFRVT